MTKLPCGSTHFYTSIVITCIWALLQCLPVGAQTAPDLIISSASSTVNTVAPNGKVSLSNSVKNQGSAAAGSFVVAFHLSGDTSYGGTDDVVISATRTVTSLSAGATNTNSTNLTVPSSTPTGTYYICVQADSADVITEGNETNNTRCTTNTIQVALADLVMTNVSPSTSSIGAGGSLPVTNTVMNQSSALTGSFKIAFRLSTNLVYGDSNDITITSSRTPSSLAGGTSNTEVTNLLIPASTAAAGYYICSKADSSNSVPESNETNNTRCSSTTIAVTRPSITGISPNIGSIGTIVTINGSGFQTSQGTSTVTFNGVTSSPTSWSTNSIITAVPAGVTTGAVLVTVNGVNSNSVTFTISSSFFVSYAYDELGRLVAVTDPASDTALYNYDASGNLLSIVRQSSSAVSIFDFAPDSGSVGAAVTLTGKGFSPNASQNIVKFNGVTASIDSATTTQIVARVPSSAANGPISVTAPSGAAVSLAPFTVVSNSAPSLLSFAPAIATPLSPVTINGSNFDPLLFNNRVRFNTTLGGLTSISGNTLVANVPISGTSGKISIATSIGQTTSANDIFVAPVPFLSSDIEHTARATFGQQANVTLSTTGKLALLLFDGSPGQTVRAAVNPASNLSLALIDPYGKTLIPLSVNAITLGPETLPYSGTYTWTAATGIIQPLAGNGNFGFDGDGGLAVNAVLNSACPGVLADHLGNIFISDSGNHRIRKVDANGIITTIAGTGVEGYGGDGGPAINAKLKYPAGLAIDSQGNLYFADNGNYRIRKISTAGIITRVAGTGVSGSSGDGGLATSAKIGPVSGIAVGSQGDLFIADENNARIRKVNAGGIITTVAGTGQFGFSGDGGPASSAKISYSKDVEVDAQGNVFFSDSGNQRIRKIDLNGTITTVAGTGTYGYNGDGIPAISASLADPAGIALDASGNILIADYSTHRIRKVHSNGIISTIAGIGFPGFAGDGGHAFQARLSNPSGVAFDSGGNLLICDSVNNRIRKVWGASGGTIKVTVLTP